MNLAERRNVHFYDAARPEQVLGGLIANPSVTNRVFLFMIGILVVTPHPWYVRRRGAESRLERNDEQLEHGDYDICAESEEHEGPVMISISDERSVRRILSRTISSRDKTFAQQVRKRDKNCVISGLENPRVDYDLWVGFEASHVFPLARESLFISENFPECITDKASSRDTGINSCQNGILLSSTIHGLFDSFEISVNPDDNDTVVCFGIDFCNVDGRKLDPVCRVRNDGKAVPDELLRWHFRQAVLANMRGAGEPVWEQDYPPGSDIVGGIMSEPNAGERMELELFTRLGGDLDQPQREGISTPSEEHRPISV
ncbi:MAG: hypothetical protein M1837_006905 [Sclerophora amabilis]|nr:MAG: hypothetical protein M1837_006905 [Sclerophora amabilis]